MDVYSLSLEPVVNPGFGKYIRFRAAPDRFWLAGRFNRVAVVDAGLHFIINAVATSSK